MKPHRVGRLGFVLVVLAAGASTMTAASQEDGPPVGLYKCSTWNPIGPAGEFSLLPRGKYSLGKEVGNYRYDPATRSVEWISGPLSGGLRPAVYTGLNPSGHTIKIRWMPPPPMRPVEMFCHCRPRSPGG